MAVSCHRLLSEAKPWKVTRFPGIRDLFAAILCVRSQPLHNADYLRLGVFPDQNPYLVDLRIEEREIFPNCGKLLPGTRFRVGVQTIATERPWIGKLSSHKKFHSGRACMSDDIRRLPLRAEVDVFIGSVYAELSEITSPL